MTSKNILLVFLVVFIPNVISWTIDLPDVRKYIFERNEGIQRGYDTVDNRDTFFYDNINGNSEHNSGAHHDKKSNYGYDANMEERVASLAQDGGRYLEGLRRSIESYIDYLENCTRMNLTLAESPTGNSTWAPQLEQMLPNMSAILDMGSAVRASCEQVTRASEHVRRLAELAMATTRRLQDLAYIDMYQKDVSEEEDALIFKLASFLDRLAVLTGFRPNPKQFLDPPITSTTTQQPVNAPSPGALVNVTEEVKNALIRCLKNNTSTVPAPERCNFPYNITPEWAAVLNMTNNSSSDTNESTQLPADGNPQLMEMLVGSDSPNFPRPVAGNPALQSFSNDPIGSFLGMDSYFQRIRKRSLNMPRSRRSKPAEGNVKRSIESHPAINFMNYFVKHKVWESSNSGKNEDKGKLKLGKFDVMNDLPNKYVKKRSLFRRKTPPFRRPQHAIKHVKDRIKETIATHYFKNKEQIIKLKNTLDSIRSITYKKSVTKANIHKRSINYEKMQLPKESEDPLQDISYYVKNKKGTNPSPNLLQAVQLRLALEQVFQTGNIEVVRRYGTNYNPLIPAPFYAGVMKSAADI